ncbi:MAG: TIGR04150 pseudo-rSAM protein [bacterium]
MSGWIVIDPFVHIAVKGDSCLLYNPLNGKILEYGDSLVVELVRDLTSPENLLIKRISLKDRALPLSVFGFIEDLRSAFMGDFIEADASAVRPIQFPPVVQVTRAVEYIRSDENRSVGEFAVKYLNRLLVYVNSDCNFDCDLCKSAYKQINWCTKANQGTLDIAVLKSAVESINCARLRSISILGGDILSYPHIEELSRFLGKKPTHKIYYLHCENLIRSDKCLRTLELQGSRLCVLATPQVTRPDLSRASQSLRDLQIDHEWLIAVRSDKEFLEIRSVFESLKITNYRIMPWFNGLNIEFFEEMVFIDVDDLARSGVSMKEIFAHQRLNKRDFGRLIILSNSDVHGNVNHHRLARLGEQTIDDALLEEMRSGQSWFRVRGKLVPCRDCLFEALCPPPSNYEIAIGRNNLCHIWDNHQPP